MTNKIDEWIDARNKEVGALTAQIAKYKSIKEKLPDLSYSVDRWKHFRLHSSAINDKVTDVDIRHSCGCCSDSPLYARPHIIVDNERIYTEDCFTIGEKSYDGGDIALPGWRTKLLNANIPQHIVDKIEAYFETNKPNKEETEDI